MAGLGLHPFLQAAVVAGADAGAEKALGNLVDENGNIVPAPTGAEIYAYFKNLNSTVGNLVSTNQAQETTIASLQTTLQQQSDLLNQFTAQLNSKASASTVSTLSQRLTTLGTTVDTKADATATAQQFQAITDLDGTQAQALVALNQAFAGEDVKVTDVLSKVTSLTNLVGGLRTDVDLKAPLTTVSTLSGRVTTLSNTVNDSATGLATKASATDLANALTGKVNLSDYNTALAGKVSTTDYTTALAGKVNTADFTPVASAFSNTTSGLAATYTLASGAKTASDTATSNVSTLSATVNNVTTGVSATYTLAGAAKSAADSVTATVGNATTGLAARALATDLTTTNGNVTALTGQLNNATTGLSATYTLAGAAKSAAAANATAINDTATGLSATYTLAGAAKTAADANTSGLATANTAIGNRLRKDAPDTTTYQLGVPFSTGMGSAVQKSELLGGIQQPYRYFLDVGATAVGAYMRSGAPAAISDALGLGQVLGITSIIIKNTGTTALATTVTLTGKDAGGNVVLTYAVPILVTAVPAVGKTADLLSLAPSLPADVPLTTPVTFTATATSGKFEIRLDGKLK